MRYHGGVASTRLSEDMHEKFVTLVSGGTTGGGAGGCESLEGLTDRIVAGMDDQRIKDIVTRLEVEVNQSIYQLRDEIEQIISNLSNCSFAEVLRDGWKLRLICINTDLRETIRQVQPIILGLIQCGYTNDIDVLSRDFSAHISVTDLIQKYITSQGSQQ